MTYEMTLLERERQGIEKVALNMFGMKMSFEEIHKALIFQLTKSNNLPLKIMLRRRINCD